MTEALAGRLVVGARDRKRGVSFIERRLLLIISDVVAVAGAFVLAFNMRTAPVRGEAFYVPRTGTAFAVAAWLCCAQVSGAYDIRIARDLIATLRTTGTALVGSFLVLLGVFFVVPYRITRPTLLLWVPVTGALVILGRLVYRRLATSDTFVSRAALVADREAIERHWPVLGHHLDGLSRVVAIVDPCGTDPIGTLQAALLRRDVDQLVLALTEPPAPDFGAAILECHERGILVRTVADLYEEVTGRVLIDQIDLRWVADLPMRADTSRLYSTAKRGVDVAAGTVGLVALGLLLLVVGPAIKVTDRGPLLHRQERVGRYGRIFRVAKLRTMRDRGETSWTAPGDARITGVGRVLRRLHLDELPQSWSILRGDMSLVGPRPEQPRYVDELASAIPFYRSRLTVRPGLTGWAQVHAGYCSGVEGAREKLSYDLYYVKHQSLSLDVLTMARTVLAVLSLNGR